MDTNWIHHNIDNFNKINWDNDSLNKFITSLNSLNLDLLDIPTKEKVTTFLANYNAQKKVQEAPQELIDQQTESRVSNVINSNVKGVLNRFIVFCISFVVIEIIIMYLIPIEAITKLIITLPGIRDLFTALLKKFPTATALSFYFIFYFIIYYFTTRLSIKDTFRKNKTIEISKLKKFKLMLVLLFPILYFVLYSILKLILNESDDIVITIVNIILHIKVSFVALIISILCNLKRIKTTG